MTNQPISSMSKPQRWLLASRPKTLPAAISPVLVGWAASIRAIYGRGGSLSDFGLLPALATMLVAVCIQIGANLVNDVSDFQKGTDSGERLGPLRVTQAGLLSPRQMWTAVFVVLGAATLAGIYLSFYAGWQVLLIGAACIAATVFYSVGRYSLSATGLGDLFAIVFFGFGAVCGTVYVLAGSVPVYAWISAFPVGLLVASILVVNNTRDMESDRRAGRMNIPVRFGRAAGETEYTLLLAGAYLSSIAIMLACKSPWVLIVWLSLPQAIRLNGRMRTTPIGPLFNQLLAQTARLTLIFSLLLAVGIVLNIYFPA
ncbi:MAG: 1,4-dihydroxy-2-naphthoate polyprenyltransferase [Chloroflexi bacterium]|nr:1,4-dihydroxy-2-naphthoate polyprenyltransferase [Chloroflexota bacterium]